jgi:glycosyltransferase involved in cell wall biosynthesis
VGKGLLKNEIRSILEVPIASNMVQIIESVPEEAFPDLLNELRLYILPSHSEGLPNTILEAMASGTPTLATPVGAISDVISQEETGFLLTSYNPKHIARTIIDLISKPTLLERVSINSQRYVIENFSYEKTLESWRKMYRDIGLL